MQVELINADDSQRAAGGFNPREFRRVLGLVWPYRRMLLLGLIATVVFAALHTASIGGAFPVFKIMLEDEGLHGWSDRTIAGGRLDVSFAPADHDGTVLRLLDVAKEGAGGQAGLVRFDEVQAADGRTAQVLLRDLAQAKAGEVVSLVVVAEDDQTERRSVSISVPAVAREHELLRWVVAKLPVAEGQEKIHTIVILLVLLVAAALFANTFRYLGEVYLSKAVLRGMMDLRARLYERTLHMPMSFFADKQTSDLVTRFVQDVQEIQRGLLTLFGRLLREPLRAAFLLALALVLDWRITIVLMLVAPITVVLFLLIGRSVKKANLRLLKAYGMMIGALTTCLQSIRVVKTYTAEDDQQARLRKVDWEMYHHQLHLAKLQAFTSPLIETIAVVAGAFAIVWLASRVLSYDLPLATFVQLALTVGVLFDPLRKLSDVYVRVQRSTAGAERIFQIIDQANEADVTPSEREVAPLSHSIEVESITFTYPGSEHVALDNVSMTIRQGESVAIVGPNGCGKTTLASMLPRLFEPQTGTIRYDGVDIKTLPLRGLREQMSVVTQEAVVFEGTPIENIAFGLPADKQDDAQAQEAARRASADDFISRLPGGYRELLGERGSTLSGGQRQRLAIARAIYRDAPILIFDEATSQIDSESELKIQQALQAFSKDRTTVVIAHRLSTIQFADRIVVMEAGKIIDTGAHKELFERCDLYRTLCETQFVAD